MFILRLSSLFYSFVLSLLVIDASRCERKMIKKQACCSKPLIMGEISTKDQDKIDEDLKFIRAKKAVPRLWVQLNYKIYSEK